MTPMYQQNPAAPETYLPHNSSRARTNAKPASQVFAGGVGSGQLDELASWIAGAGYTFEPWQIATFVTALRTKPFLILAGISGTGKTRLPRLVADATGARAVVVPVRPDWTDSSDLLGYERLTGEFVPGRLLVVCDEAMRHPDVQYFFVLDEMNVARVENYFAEVLSVIESRRWEGNSIVTDPLHPSAPEVDGMDWGAVRLPSNVSLIGTVNMDETTHGFSRKVLDRAFVLELSQVDLSVYPSGPSSGADALQWGADRWVSGALTLSDIPEPEADPVITEAVNALVRANESLANAQLQVGYRVRDEVAIFCDKAREYADFFVDRAEAILSPLDLCLSMKVLPRIQGGGAFIRDVLVDLEEWSRPSQEGSGASQMPTGFAYTHERVELMSRRLEHTGFTSFWI